LAESSAGRGVILQLVNAGSPAAAIAAAISINVAEPSTVIPGPVLRLTESNARAGGARAGRVS